MGLDATEAALHTRPQACDDSRGPLQPDEGDRVAADASIRPPRRTDITPSQPTDSQEDNDQPPPPPPPAHGGAEEDGAGEDPSDEDAEEALERIGRKFMDAKLTHIISDSGAAAMWDLFLSESHRMSKIVADGGACKYQTLRNNFREVVPPIRIDVLLEERMSTSPETGNATWQKRLLLGCDRFPTHLIHQPVDGIKRRVLFVRTHVDMKAVKQFHTDMHEGLSTSHKIQLSLDGVAMSKSSGRSMDVMSVCFEGCAAVYPVMTIIPYSTHKVTASDMLCTFFRSMEGAGLQVTTFIGDAPIRSLVLGIKLYSGYRSCPYCHCVGTRTPHLKAVVFPPSTRHAPTRTMQECQDIRQNYDKLTEAERRGLKKDYPLAPLGLDWTVAIPPEPMHSVALGVLRKLFALTFRVPSVPNSPESQFKRVPCDATNDAWVNVKMPSELQRWTRRVDFGNYKATEWKMLCTYGLPAVLLSIPPSQPINIKVRRVWCLLIAALRALLLPPEDYQAFNAAYPDRIQLWFGRFYSTYCDVFGRSACTSNVHALMHLKAFRDKCGHLAGISAYKYEASYGVLRRLYQAGCESPGLQAIRGAYQRISVGHHCRKKLKFRVQDTGKRADSLMYTRDGSIWRVKEINHEQRMLHCRKMEVGMTGSLGRGIDWHLLGIHREGPETDVTTTIPFSACVGKVLTVCQHFVKIDEESLIE